ncbi:MAG: peptidoglycan DD-metalloendopeptidase family protein [Patescibacteria group bacterium]
MILFCRKFYKKTKASDFLLILLICVLFAVPFLSGAQTIGDLNAKISEKNAEIAKLEQEIKQYQGEIEDLGKQKDSLSVSLKQLELTRKKLVADTSVTQNKIDKTNLKIKELSLEINDKQDVILNNIKAISLEMRRMYELENNDTLATILSENDFSAIWNDIDNIATVNEEIRENTLDLREVKVELEDTREETIEAKDDLVSLKNKLVDQRKVVDQNKSEKNKLLTQTKNSEANYQKLLKEQIAKKLAFEKELRDYESQLKFIFDPSKLPSAGVLSWPLDDIYVTQEFGAKTGPHRTYVKGHGGVDFRARTPAPVKSMANGTVLGVGDTDLVCQGVSLGRWMFIEYDNGLSSTFGHLSLVKVKEGQKVARGEVVAYSGGTGRVTGPHLHVSLYAPGAANVQTIPSITCPGRILRQPVSATNGYLDPMYYLPAYKQ